MNELWVPEYVPRPEMNKDGGSQFDDTLETRQHRDDAIESDYRGMVKHLNARPDHKVYVGGTKERFQLRKVFNHMYEAGVIGRHPDIKIDYGIVEGGIRIDK